MLKSERSFVCSIACLLAVAMMFGCDSRERLPAAPAGDSSNVSIASITPELSKPLVAGQAVTVQVSAAYSLAVDSGRLSIVVQDANNNPITATTEVVLKGSDVLPIKVDFVVPKTKSVSVFLALAAQGQSYTTTVTSRVYRVEDKGDFAGQRKI